MKKSVAHSILISLCLLISLTGNSQITIQTEQKAPVLIGSTVIENVCSPALEGNLLGDPATQPVKVYVPPGYNDYPDNEYPVIYLLHGYSQDYNTFYSSYSLLSLINNMISDKSIVPMIIVTPNGRTNYDGSFYTNSYVSGNWEDFMVQDLAQGIESKYRVLEQKESRGLSGFSMGGYGTVKMGMKNPCIFGSMALMGGAALDLEVTLDHGSGANKENIITAAGINEYRPGDPWGV